MVYRGGEKMQIGESFFFLAKLGFLSSHQFKIAKIQSALVFEVLKTMSARLPGLSLMKQHLQKISFEPFSQIF